MNPALFIRADLYSRLIYIQDNATILFVMSVLRKAASSLALAILLFAGFAVLVYTGLFGAIETRFYNPSVSRAALKEAELDREVIRNYFEGLNESFSAFIGEQTLRRSFLPTRSEDDVMERDRLSAALGMNHAGLQSVRFIDGDGSRIHYSTLQVDILEKGPPPVYRDYGSDPGDMPYETMAVSVKGEARLILDRRGERIVFSYPVFDAFDLYRGIAVFTLSSGSLTGALADSGRLGIGESVLILADPPGVILGLPHSGGNAAVSRVEEIRKQAGNYRGKARLDRIDPGPGGTDAPFVLVSSQTAGGFFTGRIIGEKPFIFSSAMKAILLLSFFLTSFLTIFLFFNVRADPITIVHARLRGIRNAILEECRNRKNSTLPLLSWEMEQRREDVRQEIKRTLKIKPGRNGGNSTAAAGRSKVSRSLARRLRLEKEIDAYIDLVWSELEALADRMAASGGAEPAEKREAPREKAENPPAGPRTVKPAASQAVQGRKDPAAVPAAGKGTAGLEPVKVQTALLSRPLTFTPELIGSPEPLAALQGSPAEPAAGKETAKLEPVKVQTTLLSRPLAFTPELFGSPEPLAALQGSPAEPAAGEPVFEKRDGITYINKAYTAPGNEPAKKIELDEKFKDLVDSVINDSGR
jgi:hypothetical protein